MKVRLASCQKQADNGTMCTCSFVEWLWSLFVHLLNMGWPCHVA